MCGIQKHSISCIPRSEPVPANDLLHSLSSCLGQIKNNDEEVAINRRVSFHHDGDGGLVAATSNRSATDSDLPIFSFEQQQQSQSQPSLVTTFAQRSVAAIRRRKSRKKKSRSRSALDNHESMGGGLGGGKRGGLSKTLKVREYH